MERVKGKVQIGEGLLSVSKATFLLVGIDPKRKKPAFIPQFVDDDYMANGEAATIRIYIPNNDPGLQEDEKWQVKVTAYKLSKRETKDGRNYLYINVDVISREEYVERQVDEAYQNLIINRKSGYRVLETKKLPLTEKRGWFRDGNIAVHTWIYFIEDKAVAISPEEQSTREAYIHDLMKTSKKISQKAASDAFEKLPSLPETTPLSEFTI